MLFRTLLEQLTTLAEQDSKLLENEVVIGGSIRAIDDVIGVDVHDGCIVIWLKHRQPTHTQN